VIEVRSITARSGGQLVTLSGKIELPLKAAPKYDFALKGENLPLVRQTGLLVRADVDLKLATPKENVPTLSGTVRLRDSMYLSDLRAFIPRGGGGAPTRRPPYFAIENPPLNAWRLNVGVHGEKFMRLRSTLFTGTASARFTLGGTLGEPHLTGEATVDSGIVLLPFAAFKIDEASVRVTEADPNSLRLFATGTSRRYGYDLRMEASGTADAPVVTFSSSPALDAKQVLLMVMAGELPNDEITYGTSQRAARLGTYLGQSLISSFGGDPSDASRLTIMTGERVSSLGKETYQAEYRLTDRFTIVGEYDEYDAYNTGVKWSVRPAENPVKEKTEPPVAGKKEAPREQPK
jgi:translocation and assembly module TamB